MNSIKVIIAGLFMSLSACAAAPAYAETIQEVADSVYRVYDANLQTICSSVAISETRLLTASHCLDNSVFLVFNKFDPKGTIVSSTVVPVFTINRDRKSDVAVIELMDRSFKLDPTRICTENHFQLGDQAFAIGYPKGQELTLTEGMFTSHSWLVSLGLDGPFYKTTIPITGGNSGGGLFISDPMGYCLTGLATASYKDISFMSYFSTLESIENVQ